MTGMETSRLKAKSSPNIFGIIFHSLCDKVSKLLTYSSCMVLHLYQCVTLGCNVGCYFGLKSHWQGCQFNWTVQKPKTKHLPLIFHSPTPSLMDLTLFSLKNQDKISIQHWDRRKMLQCLMDVLVSWQALNLTAFSFASEARLFFDTVGCDKEMRVFSVTTSDIVAFVSCWKAQTSRESPKNLNPGVMAPVVRGSNWTKKNEPSLNLAAIRPQINSEVQNLLR